MANLRTRELGRHQWVEGFQEDRLRGATRPVLKCANCARVWDLMSRGESGIPVVGCISDVDLRRLGTSEQADQLERDFRRGLYQSQEH